MKKYKNRIVNDLERRLSKIDTEKKILFLKKMDVAKGYVIEIFCNQFLKNKIAIDLFKRSVSKKDKSSDFGCDIILITQCLLF